MRRNKEQPPEPEADRGKALYRFSPLLLPSASAKQYSGAASRMVRLLGPSRPRQVEGIEVFLFVPLNSFLYAVDMPKQGSAYV